MEQFKNASVVMLPTNSKSHLYLTDKNILGYITGKIESDLEQFPNQTGTQNQHLYITSLGKIEEHNYYIHGGRLHKHLGKKCLDVFTNKTYTISKMINDSVFKKVIATTDNSLVVKDNGGHWTEDDYVPQLSQEFIEYYIKEYNKENVINNVEVECERNYSNRNCGSCNLFNTNLSRIKSCEISFQKVCKSSSIGSDKDKKGDYWVNNWENNQDYELYDLKINPDNTINIKKVKESWTREEVVNLLYKHTEDILSQRLDLEQWITQNL